jgi:hypothetical protein
MFLRDVVWSGTFGDPFRSRTVYATQQMASVYYLPPVTRTELQAVTTTGDAYETGPIDGIFG